MVFALEFYQGAMANSKNQVSIKVQNGIKAFWNDN